jgi:tRNA nucleotidyltransferase (CCA-adding enzyme)
LAANFGGGGHERAAAAIIKNKKLSEVHQEMIELLPQVVQPAITVAQIMSGNPQLLSPDTLAGEAARWMQRYGHEGYPVVSDGKVIGLLTRRAVDRALSHDLKGYTAENLMDAGEHTILPDESVESLQRLMSDTGWGQVPVVDSVSGEIIGIVTRTDVLKTLTAQPRVPSRINLGNRLERALTSPRLTLLKDIAAVADEERIAVYIVGGYVRDLLLDRPSLDFDLVVEGDAIALARALAKRYGGRITSHTRFGTAKWILSRPMINSSPTRMADKGYEVLDEDPGAELPVSLDLVTARTEFYTYPTALPTVERGSIKLDLHRRDFTINTLALRLDGGHYGELHDYWGGLADLRQGFVRVLHSLSFVDDPTRILRAVRFEQRFDFRIEARTLDLLLDARSLLERISGDRIRHEFDNILGENCAVSIMDRLDSLGIIRIIHPDLVWDEWSGSRLSAWKSFNLSESWMDLIEPQGNKWRIFVSYILWLLRLTPEQARRVCERLKLPTQLKRMVQSASTLFPELNDLSQASPSAATLRLEGVEPLALLGVYLAADTDASRDLIERYVSKWRNITPAYSGHDLKARGVPPGPIYRDVLGALRSAWLDGAVGSVEEEKALLEDLLKAYEQ